MLPYQRERQGKVRDFVTLSQYSYKYLCSFLWDVFQCNLPSYLDVLSELIEYSRSFKSDLTESSCVS